MSEPKRYDNFQYETAGGEYVRYEDYALLKSEVQRLENNCNYLDQKLDEEIDKSAMLCGQIERLTDSITAGYSITPDAKPE